MIGFGPGAALHRDSRFDVAGSVACALRAREVCSPFAHRVHATLSGLSCRVIRMPDQPSRRGAWLALAVMVMVWAYSWVIMKQVLVYAGPFDFAALRY